VEGVAEGDDPPAAPANHVGGVARGVAGREQDTHTGEDFLALRHGAHARLQRLEHLGAGACRGGEVALGPLGFGDQVVGAGERRLGAPGGGMPCPSEVVEVQVGDRDRLDLRGLAAERAEVVQQGAAVDRATRAARLRVPRLRAEPGVDQQRAVTALHQQPADAGHQAPRLVEVLGAPRPDLVGGVRQPAACAEPHLTVRNVGHRRVAQ
jgi:hypothetical protein